jgi:hypothetical protein
VRAAQKKATADTPHATKAVRRRISPIVPSMWTEEQPRPECGGP